MREQLLGYLLGALEPTEHEMVEARLAEDPALQEDLIRLRDKVAPLAADDEHEDYDPPAGLAARTCNFVAARAGQPPQPAADLVPAGSWRLQDLLVAGGICIAASLLVFPAISHSQFKARLTACQNNLREIGTALTHYSQSHKGYFPLVPQQGKLAVAGAYAPMLREAGFLEDAAHLICPSLRWPSNAITTCRRWKKSRRRRPSDSPGCFAGWEGAMAIRSAMCSMAAIMATAIAAAAISP